jgi:hypothetical protein
MVAGRTPFEQQLADDGRVLSSLSWLRQSGYSTRVVDERMVVYAANGAICAYCYTADEVVAFARRQSPVRGAGVAPLQGPVFGQPVGATDGPGHAVRVRDLEETIRYLRERWHTTVAERDEWERRARVAEQEAEALRAAQPPAPEAGSMTAEARYAALRRFLARELHPDGAPSAEEVRAVKADLFKLVWAEITRIDKA